MDQSTHQNLIEKINQSELAEERKKETLRVVDEAFKAIELQGAFGDDAKRTAIEKYETVRQETLSYLRKIHKECKIGLCQERNAIHASPTRTEVVAHRAAKPEMTSKGEILSNEEVQKLNTKKLAFLLSNLEDPSGIITRVTIPNGDKVDKAFEEFAKQFGTKQAIYDFLASNPNMRTSVLGSEKFTNPNSIIETIKALSESGINKGDLIVGYFKNLCLKNQKSEEIATGILLSIPKIEQSNGSFRISKTVQNFINSLPLGLRDNKDYVIKLLKNLSEKKSAHGYNLGALATELLGNNKDEETIREIVKILDFDGKRTFLVNIPYDILVKIKEDKTFLQEIGINENEIKGIEDIRYKIYVDFQNILQLWINARVESGGRAVIPEYKDSLGNTMDYNEQIMFINSQIYTQGGIKEHRDNLKLLVSKDFRFFDRIEALKGDKEIVLHLLNNRRANIGYFVEKISPTLINDTEIIDNIIKTKDDAGLIDIMLSRIVYKPAKEHIEKRMKELGIEYNQQVVNTFNISGEKIQREIEQQKTDSEYTQKESSTDKGTLISNRNENGTYDVSLGGQTIPGLTAEEYQGLENEKVKENLLHFYTVLKDCGLEQIWGQRESIFKAITNQKGIAFNTKDGDYLGANEVKIFLQSVIKSIASQFKEQGELTKALNTENEQEIISFIKNYNGENNLAGPTKDKLGRTKIVEIFFDTHFPQDKDRRFQQASFESSLIS